MKIQNVIHKILLLSFINLYSGQMVLAQTDQAQLLKTADSLYAARQYTQSYKLYDQLYREQGVWSPAMLLRMAFIQEGLGDHSEALYYLNEYYILTSDERAVEKIQQLSEAHNLRGYTYQDYDLFLRFFREHRFLFLYGLLAIALVGLAYVALRKKRIEHPYGFGVSYVILLGLLFFITNFSVSPRQAIITADNTYIMKGPSAGAAVVSVSGKGHRVTVEGQQDVWTKIEWEGQPAFVRQHNLRFINP